VEMADDEYDVIVCGAGSAGSAGSVVAGLLAADEGLRVLLLEAGPDDADDRVSDPDRWPQNLGSERDWAYVTAPGAQIDGRRLLYSMGKGLGGGSSVNVGVWSRGHRRDWDDFAGGCMSPQAEARYGRPEPAFTFLLGMRLRSRGSVRLADANPASAPVIETGYFDEPDDLRDAVEAYRFAEAIAHAEAMRPYQGGRAIPGNGPDAEVAAYIRAAASTFWHQCGTARVGTDGDAVVDPELRVRGLEGLRVADASVLPRVTSGNTMAPCVVIGYRAAGLVRDSVSNMI
jgi:choline dehydrogenase-like flavoprotein